MKIPIVTCFVTILYSISLITLIIRYNLILKDKIKSNQLILPHHILKESILPIVTIDNKYFFYKSYWETRYSSGNFVRTLGYFHQEEPKYKYGKIINESDAAIDCYLWYGDNEKVQGTVQVAATKELWLNVFMTVFYKCYPNNTKEWRIPHSVSFVPRKRSDYIHKLMKIHQFKTTFNPKRSIACIKPMYGPFNDTEAISQFITYYKEVMKVDHFVFYYISLSENVKKLFKKFTDLGLSLEIIYHYAPGGENEALHDHGQIVQSIDCSLSNMDGLSVHVDLDEFIVTKQKDLSLVQLYNKTLLENKKKYDNKGHAVLVSHTLFMPLSENQRKLSNLPIILRSFNKSISVQNPIARSKMIVDPRTAVDLQVHYVPEFINKEYKQIICPIEIAVMHHYRSTKVDIGEEGTERNTDMLKYKDKILNSK